MSFLTKILPPWENALLAVLAAVLLIVAFPDFEWWWTAWFALVPLMWAVERVKESVVRSLVVGWIFGTVFFFGTCSWLTFAPINYAGFPAWLAYSGMVFIAAAVGLFPALFAGILAVLLRRFGSWAFLAAPFVWVFTEFLRYWLTGNNWNTVGYSQAFVDPVLRFAHFGGVLLISFLVLLPSGLLCAWKIKKARFYLPVFAVMIFVLCSFASGIVPGYFSDLVDWEGGSWVIGIQANVPMSGVNSQKLDVLRGRQIDLAEAEIRKINEQSPVGSSEFTVRPITVILPESPMNFMYNDDLEFQKFIGDFARRNNVSVLFNSAEPDATSGKYFNSAVMVGRDGREAAQYDKIYLLPFGEAVPLPLEGLLPGFVGNFSYGREYDILPVGDAKAGVMICFESHFGQLSRRYVQDGADVIIEMTNDGYLGPTPVLRQHLANAIFRAVETNRPVLRVTNVGVTAYINERGAVLNPAPTYQEDTQVWSVSKSDGSQTFYVRYGDWFAWLCSMVTMILVVFSLKKRKLLDQN